MSYEAFGNVYSTVIKVGTRLCRGQIVCLRRESSRVYREGGLNAPLISYVMMTKRGT